MPKNGWKTIIAYYRNFSFNELLKKVLGVANLPMRNVFQEEKKTMCHDLS